MAAIAFADDVILYTKSKQVSIVRNELENITEKINKYYMAWNLRVNPQKCETILFRKPLRSIHSKYKAGSSTFSIEITNPGTNEKQSIPHKKIC